MRICKRLISMILCAALLAGITPSARATGEMSVTMSYTCAEEQLRVGSELHFVLKGVGTVAYQLMVVDPDSLQAFYPGEQISVTLTKPGLYVFIAYGANGTDPAVPGFERCMSSQLMLTVEDSDAIEGEDADLPEGLALFTPYSEDVYPYDGDDAAFLIFWTTAGIAEGMLGSLNVYDSAGKFLGGSSVSEKELLDGMGNIGDFVRGKPANYRVELAVYDGVQRVDAASLDVAVNKHWAMAYVDRLAYSSGDLYHTWRRWSSNIRPPITRDGYDEDDWTNSGYLMLDQLLDTEYDYEAAKRWFPWYQGVTYALKLDIGGTIAMYEQGKADGWGAQDFADALSKTCVYYVRRMTNLAEDFADEEELRQKLGEKFLDILDLSMDAVDTFDLLDRLDAIPAQNYEALKAAFGRSGGAGREALKAMMKEDGQLLEQLRSLGVEFTDAGNVMMRFSNDSADKLYRALREQGLLNSEAGHQFQRAYLEVKDAKVSTAGVTVNFALKAASLSISLGQTISKAWERQQAYDREEQEALELLTLMTCASADYVESLEAMRHSPYMTDQMRAGFDRYLNTLKEVMAANLEERLNDLEQMAAEMAGSATSGKTTEAVWSVLSFVYDVLDAMSIKEAILLSMGIDAATITIPSKAGFIMSLINLGTGLVEMGVEYKWHVTSKFDAAENMYVYQLLIQANHALIHSRLSEYASHPTVEAAEEIVHLLQHQRALKFAGESAAWAFVSIDLDTAIQRAYQERRDQYIKVLKQRHPLAMMTYAGRPERTLTVVSHILVDGERVSVDSYLDLAKLLERYGADRITRQQVTNTANVVPLNSDSELMALLYDTIEIIHVTKQDIERSFAITEAWIESLPIPDGPETISDRNR